MYRVTPRRSVSHLPTLNLPEVRLEVRKPDDAYRMAEAASQLQQRARESGGVGRGGGGGGGGGGNDEDDDEDDDDDAVAMERVRSSIGLGEGEEGQEAGLSHAVMADARIMQKRLAGER